jgi:hypothetical protein
VSRECASFDTVADDGDGAECGERSGDRCTLERRDVGDELLRELEQLLLALDERIVAEIEVDGRHERHVAVSDAHLEEVGVVRPPFPEADA